MVRILITGGKGYIAQAIFNALQNEYDITLISKDDFDLIDTKATNQWFQNKQAKTHGLRPRSSQLRLFYQSGLRYRDNLLRVW